MYFNSLTLCSSGVLGASQAQGVDIAVITNPGAGRYLIWGTVRHSLVDGCRLYAGATPLIPNIAAGAGSAVGFGPVIIDIVNNTTSIILELATATGGSDSASGTLYAQKL